MTQADLVKIRRSVHQHIGQKVKISANRGRHKFMITEGIIKETYPNLFIVEIIPKEEMDIQSKTISFSYQDVMTKDVRMMLCS